jgi:hypothetical protein
MIKDLLKALPTGGKIVDDLTESGEERQAVLSERHRLDMNSDNPLSKSIRPIATLWTGLIWGVVTLIAIVRGSVDWDIYAIASGPFVTCISFYFESRKREKMAAQNAQANVQMENLKLKHDQKIERKEVRQDRRNARRSERSQEIEG